MFQMVRFGVKGRSRVGCEVWAPRSQDENTVVMNVREMEGALLLVQVVF